MVYRLSRSKAPKTQQICHYRHTRKTSELFLLFNTGVDFSLHNNFSNSGSFAKDQNTWSTVLSSFLIETMRKLQLSRTDLKITFKRVWAHVLHCSYSKQALVSRGRLRKTTVHLPAIDTIFSGQTKMIKGNRLLNKQFPNLSIINADMCTIDNVSILHNVLTKCTQRTGCWSSHQWLY